MSKTNAVVPLKRFNFLKDFDYSDCNSDTLIHTNQHELTRIAKKNGKNDVQDYDGLLKKLSTDVRKQLCDDKTKNMLAQRFFTISLLEYTCHMNAKSPQEGDVIYKEIAQKLVSLNLLPGELFKDTFKQIRFQYNQILRKIFHYQMRMPAQITYDDQSKSSDARRLTRSKSINALNSRNQNGSGYVQEAYMLYSRYAFEFTEIKLIGSGGFGKVFVARNNLDGNEYAIKKINFRKSTVNLSSSALREIQFLSKLNHKNIVNYHNCWLENVFVPLGGEQKTKFKSSESESNFLKITSVDNDDIITTAQAQPIISLPSSSSSSSNRKGFFNDSPTNCSSFSSSDKTSSIQSSVEQRKKSSTTNDHKQLKSQIVLFIQMKLCDCTLKQWLHERNEQIFLQSDIKLDGELSLNLFRQLLEGVSYIHSSGIIHRDLKPGNIFLMRDTMQIKIGDFGLACADLMVEKVKTMNESKYNEKNVSEHTIGVGTSLYSSPEQLHMNTYDFKVDMYSLGIILFELYEPFSTDMEKTISIDKLKKKSLLSKDIQKKWPKQCDVIKQLVNNDKNTRPSALNLLNSELFMSQEEVVASLRKLLNEKNTVIENLREKIKEKDEMIEQRDEIIRTICGLNY